MPFIHVNAALAPAKDNSFFNKIRAACGFGVAAISDGISAELYYNVAVKKNKNELVNEFGFSLGLD